MSHTDIDFPVHARGGPAGTHPFPQIPACAGPDIKAPPFKGKGDYLQPHAGYKVLWFKMVAAIGGVQDQKVDKGGPMLFEVKKPVEGVSGPFGGDKADKPEWKFQV